MRRRNWAVLLLAPVLLSGCSMFSASGGGSGSGSGAATPGSGGGQSWVVVQQGTPAPSVRPSFGTPSPSPSATGGFLPLPPAAPRPSATATCAPQFFKFTSIAAAEVTPGPTSAVVSWYNVGGSNLTEFRLTAIDQDLIVGKQIDVGWTTVKATSCGWMSATVPNLQRRTGYVFSVDAVVYRRSGDGTYAATVARSHVIRTT